MSHNTPAFLAGGAELGALIRAFDWGATSLGPPEGWPDSLRTLVRVMLASKQPMFIAWGPDRIMLYNDGYAPLCGNRHPWALGRPFDEVWADIYDNVRPIMDAAYAGTSTYMDDIEFTMMRNGFPEVAHFSFSYTPVTDEDSGRVLGMFCTCQETTAELAVSELRRQEIERWREIFSQAPVAIAVLDGPKHVYTVANPAYLRLVGGREVLGKALAEALPEVVEQGFVELLDKVYTSGEAYVGRNVQLDLQQEPGGPTEQRILDFVYQPIRAEGRGVTGIFVQATDVTEQRRAEALQHVLNQEISHRLKNTLAMVQAVATQTLRSLKDHEQVKALEGRIHALGSAHDVLIARKWESASMERIIASALQVFARGDRITVSGPEVRVGPRTTLSLSLLIHELGTNAVKYGALSSEAGEVTVTWRLEQEKGEAIVVLHWMERGGPAAAMPTRRGFGSRLIAMGLVGTGGVELRFTNEGLEAKMRAPLAQVQAS